MKDFLDARFETEEVKANVVSNGVVGLAGGPYSPGSVYMVLHYWPELGGTYRHGARRHGGDNTRPWRLAPGATGRRCGLRWRWRVWWSGMRGPRVWS